MIHMIQNAKDQVLALTNAAYEAAVAAGKLPADVAVRANVEIPKDPANGDYTTTFALAAAKAMKKSLAKALFENDRIKTTETRAKALRSVVDPIITWAKKGDLHSRRLAIAKLGDKQLVAEIFDKAAQGMWQDRNGGYTRIMKLGNRKGDNAPIVIMELVTEPCTPKAKKAAPAPKKAAAPKKVEAVEETAAEEAPAEETAE